MGSPGGGPCGSAVCWMLLSPEALGRLSGCPAPARAEHRGQRAAPVSPHPPSCQAQGTGSHPGSRRTSREEEHLWAAQGPGVAPAWGAWSLKIHPLDPFSLQLAQWAPLRGLFRSGKGCTRALSKGGAAGDPLRREASDSLSL